MTAALLTAADVAARLQVSRAQAYREMKKMHHVVIGSKGLRVTDAAVTRYLDQRGHRRRWFERTICGFEA